MSERDLSICRRLETLRVELFGARGKSEMARRLDIRPSTYDRYERDRVPPADLLVQIATVSNVTLEWLLTGDGPKRPHKTADIEAETLTRQFKELLVNKPSFRPVSRQLLDWLETQTTQSSDALQETDVRPHTLIPVVGDTTGGTLPLWEPLLREPKGLAEKVATLIEQSADSRTKVAGSILTEANGVAGLTGSVIILRQTVSEPPSLLELIDAGAFTNGTAGAVAWRMSDDCMAPRYEVGDLIVASLEQPAAVGQPCVASRSGQEGVSVKIFHREADDVLLIPSNPKHPVERFAEADLNWACGVLGVVRFE